MATSKYWCFTLSDDVIPDAPEWDEDTMTYLVVGHEIAAGGFEHWQGYVEFGYRKSILQCKKLLGQGHYEARKGSAEQAALYCKKDGQFYENGTLSFSAQGRCSDLSKAIKLIIESGESLPDLADKFPGTYVRYNRGLEKLVAIRKKTIPWRKVAVEIHWGVPGSGKTRQAFDRFPDLYRYRYAAGAEWWDGYDGQSAILFDEFEGQLPLKSILEYCDGHPLPLWVKGGRTVAAWTTVIFTSNYPPTDWWPPVKFQENRRVSLVKEYKEPILPTAIIAAVSERADNVAIDPVGPDALDEYLE